MNSTYVTFGEFNPEPPPPPQMRHHDDLYRTDAYAEDSSHPRPARYPIRQHMTQPRNPYLPQMLPPYPRHDTPATMYQLPMPTTSMPSNRQPPSYNNNKANHFYDPEEDADYSDSSALVVSQPPKTTPIGQAFSETFDMTMPEKSMTPSPRMNHRLMDATCVDINDHIVSCPICSKYYQNHTTVYVGIIILLGFIILIFLLKSIMEVKR